MLAKQRTLVCLALLFSTAAAQAQSPCAIDAFPPLGPTGANAWELFGTDVAIDGDFLVVGHRSHAAKGFRSGAAWVYRFDGAAWVQDAFLQPALVKAWDDFGSSVAIDGDTLVVGWPGGDSFGLTHFGAAQVYERIGGVWTEGARLEPLPELNTLGLRFGFSVAVEGDLAVIGGPAETPTWRKGAAAVFRRTAGPAATWIYEDDLQAPDGAANDLFGYGVDVDGERIVVGAMRHAHEDLDDAGSAYVFERVESDWTATAELVASDAAEGDLLGFAVALEGDRALLGAPSVDTPAPGAGAAYVFERAASGAWIEQQRLGPVDFGIGTPRFGTDVALAGSKALVGSPGYNGFLYDDGAAYLFERGATGWAPLEFLRLPTPAASDQFGNWVAIDGQRAAVSAWGDDPQGTVTIYDAGARTVFSGSPPSVALGAGGAHTLTICAEQPLAGASYFVLGTASGTTPGIVPLADVLLPLNLDPYFLLTLGNPAGALFGGSFAGLLDGGGGAQATLSLPPGLHPALAGTTVHHAAVILEGIEVAFVSAPVALDLVP